MKPATLAVVDLVVREPGGTVKRAAIQVCDATAYKYIVDSLIGRQMEQPSPPPAAALVDAPSIEEEEQPQPPSLPDVAELPPLHVPPSRSVTPGAATSDLLLFGDDERREMAEAIEMATAFDLQQNRPPLQINTQRPRPHEKQVNLAENPSAPKKKSKRKHAETTTAPTGAAEPDKRQEIARSSTRAYADPRPPQTVDDFFVGLLVKGRVTRYHILYVEQLRFQASLNLIIFMNTDMGFREALVDQYCNRYPNQQMKDKISLEKFLSNLQVGDDGCLMSPVAFFNRHYHRLRAGIFISLLDNLRKMRHNFKNVTSPIVGISGGLGNICLLNRHTCNDELVPRVRNSNATLNEDKPGRRIFGFLNIGPEKVSQTLTEDGVVISVEVPPAHFILYDEDANPSNPSVGSGHGDNKYSIILYLNYFIAYGEELPHKDMTEKVKVCEALPIANGKLLTYPHMNTEIPSGLGSFLQEEYTDLCNVDLQAGEVKKVMDSMKHDFMSFTQYFDLQRI